MANAANYSGDDPNLVLARRIRKIMDARPELSGDLNLLAQIASRPGTDDDVIRLAGDVSAGSEAGQYITEMRSMSGDRQRESWKNLSDERKAVLTQFGYKPPAAKGFFDIGLKVPHSVGDVVHDVVHTATAPAVLTVRGVKKVGGEALHGMTQADKVVTTGIGAVTGLASGTDENFILNKAAPVFRGIGRAMQSPAGQVAARFYDPFNLTTGKIAEGLANTQDQGSQYNAALEVKTREAIAATDTAVAEGRLTARQRDRLFARQDGVIEGTNIPRLPDLLDWWENTNDPDMPHDLQSWRAIGGSLGDAWHAEYTGRLFTPTSELAALKQIPDQSMASLSLAKAVASGLKPEDILRRRGLNPNDPDWAARLGDIVDVMQKPGFDAAVKTLSGGHMSFGSQVVTLAGGDPLTANGRKVAGGLDFAMMWELSPANVAGKSVKAYREARALIGADEAAGFLSHASEYAKDPAAWRRSARQSMGFVEAANAENRLQGFVRATDRIAAGFAESAGVGDASGIKKLVYAMPGLNGSGLEFLANTWKEGAWRTGADLIDVINTERGLSVAMAGSFARAGDIAAEGRMAFPYLSRPMAFSAEATSIGKRLVEVGASLGGGAEASFVEKAVQHIFKPVALLARVPNAPYMAIDDNAKFQKLLRFGQQAGMSSEKTDRVLYDYLFAVGGDSVEAGSFGARRQIVDATIRDILETAGITDNGPARLKIARERLFERLRSQAYATDGRDLLRNADGTVTNNGLWATLDHSPNVQIPTYRELAAAADENWYGARLYRATHWDWMEQFQGKRLREFTIDRLTGRWKGNVMLRPAFGIRFGGEEVTGMMTREGASAYVSAVAAAKAAKRDLVTHLEDLAEQASKSAKAGDLEKAAQIRADIEKVRIGWAGRMFTKPLEGMTGVVHKTAGKSDFAVLRKIDSGVAAFYDRIVLDGAAKATDLYRAGVGRLAGGSAALTEASMEAIGAPYVRRLAADEDLYNAVQHLYTYDPFAAENAMLEVAGHHATWRTVSRDPEKIGQFYLDSPEELVAGRVRSYFQSVSKDDPEFRQAVAGEYARLAASPEYPGIYRGLSGIVSPNMNLRFVQATEKTPWVGRDAVEVIGSARKQLADLGGPWRKALDDVAGSAAAQNADVKKFLEVTSSRTPFDVVKAAADNKAVTSVSAGLASRELSAANLATDKGAAAVAEKALDSVPRTGESAYRYAWDKAKRAVQAEAKKNPEARRLLIVMNKVEKHLDAVELLGTREASLMFSDVTPRMRVAKNGARYAFSREDTRQALNDAVRGRYGTERMQAFFDQSERALTVSGVPVARPLAEGHLGTYLPLLDPAEQAAWHQAVQNGLTPAQAARFNSLNPTVQNAVAALVEGTDPALAAKYTAANIGGYGPVSTVAVGDYRTAQNLHAELTWILTGDKVKPADKARLLVGAVDIRLPSGGHTGEWVRGGRLPQVRGLEEDGVRVGSMLGTDGFNIRFDKIGDPIVVHPDASTTINGVVRPGASREAALEEWVGQITDQAYDYLVAPSGDPLHEVIHALNDLDHPHVLDRVNAIAPADLPATVKAMRKEITASPESLYSKIADFGWSVTDGQLQGIARQPIYIQAYAKQIATRDEWLPVVLGKAEKYQAGRALGESTGAQWAFDQVWTGLGRNRMSTGVDDFVKHYDELRAEADTARWFEAKAFADAGLTRESASIPVSRVQWSEKQGGIHGTYWLHGHKPEESVYAGSPITEFHYDDPTIGVFDKPIMHKGWATPKNPLDVSSVKLSIQSIDSVGIRSIPVVAPDLADELRAAKARIAPGHVWQVSDAQLEEVWDTQKEILLRFAKTHGIDVREDASTARIAEQVGAEMSRRSGYDAVVDRVGEVDKSGDAYAEYLDLGSTVSDVPVPPTSAIKPTPALSRDEARTVLEGLREGHAVQEHMAAAARAAAVKSVAPYIHDVRQRTMFSELMSTAMPFRFAEEQFIQRWATTLRHTPDALHRLQMLVSGAESIGVIKEDEYGNKMFNVPVMPAVYHMIARTPVLSRLLSTDATGPSGAGYAFAIDGLAPGLKDPAHMGTSPMVRLPLSVMSHFLPEVEVFRNVNEALQGDYRSDMFEAFFPGWQKTILKAYMMDKDESETASAMLYAWQAMSAEGTRLHQKAAEARAAGHAEAADQLDAKAETLLLPDNATDEQLDDWIREAKHRARATLLTRAVTQFALPTSGRIVPKVELTKEFMQHYLTRKGADGRPITYNEAVQQFVTDHPDGLPYTVPGSETVAGARTDLSLVAAQWLEDNKEFAKGNRRIAAWFLPPVGEGFSSEAVWAVTAAKWKQIKGPEDWLTDLAVAEAAPIYMKSKEARDAAAAAVKGNPVEEARLNDEWKRWEEGFVATHPRFWKDWTSHDKGGERAMKRQLILDAAAAGTLPKGPHTDAIVDLTASFRDYMALRETAQYKGGSNLAKANKKALDEKWKVYVDNALLKTPTITAFYAAMIYRDMPDNPIFEQAAA